MPGPPSILKRPGTSSAVRIRQLDTAALQRRFGAPRTSFPCDGAEVQVYGEGFDSALREAFADELKVPRGDRAATP